MKAVMVVPYRLPSMRIAIRISVMASYPPLAMLC